LEAAVFGLLGLLLAFTFSAAVQRVDERRQLIGEEANTIVAADWQADLLRGTRDARYRLKPYLEAPVEVSRQPHLIEGSPDFLASKPMQRSKALQAQIWQTAVAANGTERRDPVDQLLLPTLPTCLPSRVVAIPLGTSIPPKSSMSCCSA